MSLRAAIRELLTASDALVGPPVPEGEIPVLALGALLLGRELAEGVLSEAAPAAGPRGLNAQRLARHLWEVETDLHYVTARPETRLPQMLVREAGAILEIYRSHPRAARPAFSPERKALFEDAEARAAALDQAAEARSRAGEAVPADDWGSFPTRLRLCKALGRPDEYFVYYGYGSLFSHPSIAAIDETMLATAAGVVPRPEHDHRNASMALSLTRTTLARLLLRVARILAAGAPDLADEVEAHMRAAAIPETGVVGIR